MKRIAIGVLAVAISTAAGGAFAQNYGQNYGDRGGNDTTSTDRAQVLRVQRVGYNRGPDSYERQECWNERTSSYDSGYYGDDNGRLYQGDHNSKVAGTLLGALVGGALGNQVGKGDGRKAATVAGAVIGGAIGNNASRDDDGYRYNEYRDNGGVVRRCRTVVTSNNNYNNYGNYDNNYRGYGRYKVTYRYAGKTYQAMTERNPGNWLRVRVEVQPAEDYRR